jgi:hypothetical protein
MDEYESEHGMHRASVSPAEVRQIIVHALSRGWDPSERGAAFKLRPYPEQPQMGQYEIVDPI